MGGKTPGTRLRPVAEIERRPAAASSHPDARGRWRDLGGVAQQALQLPSQLALVAPGYPGAPPPPPPPGAGGGPRREARDRPPPPGPGRAPRAPPPPGARRRPPGGSGRADRPPRAPGPRGRLAGAAPAPNPPLFAGRSSPGRRRRPRPPPPPSRGRPGRLVGQRQRLAETVAGRPEWRPASHRPPEARTSCASPPRHFTATAQVSAVTASCSEPKAAQKPASAATAGQYGERQGEGIVEDDLGAWAHHRPDGPDTARSKSEYPRRPARPAARPRPPGHAALMLTEFLTLGRGLVTRRPRRASYADGSRGAPGARAPPRGHRGRGRPVAERAATSARPVRTRPAMIDTLACGPRGPGSGREAGPPARGAPHATGGRAGPEDGCRPPGPPRLRSPRRPPGPSPPGGSPRQVWPGPRRRPRWGPAGRTTALWGALALAALLLWAARRVLPPFVLGAALAYLLNPLVATVSRRTRLPRRARPPARSTPASACSSSWAPSASPARPEGMRAWPSPSPGP